MHETLQEFVDSRGVAVRADRQEGILRGVKILGLQSRNGRRYLPEVLAKAVALYEGAKVNVNHPKGSPAGPRDYQDRIGVIRNVALRTDEGLFADFHFNPKHALAEQLLWDAHHAPENVGFSHNVTARTARRGQETIVEDILRVESVDLVADPATTRGLFEAAGETPTGEPAHPLAGLTVEQLRERRPDLVDEIISHQSGQLEQLHRELEHLRQAEAARQKLHRVKQLLREFQLPDPDSGDAWAQAVVDPRLLEQLMESPDEAFMRELLRERVHLIRAAEQSGRSTTAGAPLSREQNLADPAPPVDTKAFVAAIT